MPRRRSRAQGYVEFGLAMAVAALIAMVGMDQLRGVIYMYFTGDAISQTLNPPLPPSTGPSTHTTTAEVNCPSGTLELNTYHTCTARIYDPSDPNFHPTGASIGIVSLSTSATGGALGHGEVSFGASSAASITCQLTSLAPAPGSACTFTYYADVSGRPSQCPSGCTTVGPYTLNIHAITATYSPPMASGITGSTDSASFYMKRFAAVELNYPVAGPYNLCSSFSVAVGSSIWCTVHVQDRDTGPQARPTGTVTWKIGGTTTGLSPTTCTLVPFGGDPTMAECQSQVNFAPLISQLGTPSFRIEYLGDALYSDWGLLNGPVPVTVDANATTTTLSPCSLMAVQISDPIPANRTTKCHVTVASTSAPSGKVTWDLVGGVVGTFDNGSGSPDCTLVATSALSSECDIWFTPTVSSPATQTVRATFAAQGIWNTSNSNMNGTSQPIAVTP